MLLNEIVKVLRSSRYFQHKHDISEVLSCLSKVMPINAENNILIGDDCAVIPEGDGFLLFAIEGLVGEFVREMPWFAGYSGVMVNVSDIYAMGGRPIAVVNALWSEGAINAEQILDGMARASKAYGVPIVGGHSNVRSNQGQLAVSILGKAKKLLTSFNARTGDKLLMAIDMRGKFEGSYPYWNASSKASSERLKNDLEILPLLAEEGLCDAAKDISMAGVIGTSIMLMECSKVGANINLNQIPIPSDMPILRWLSAFPSFGFVLSVRPEHCEAVISKFKDRFLVCEEIGVINDTKKVTIEYEGDTEIIWDFNSSSFILPPEEN
ncbi:sll0787 family AIR synthase-like protein [Methylotenera sp.]|uniref:sll0787 family AIR synthase-like protein n=1 Tax=Methylotenera sp. TaxID=2051956 RepID=UPI002735F445|nr:sll0787 family AIR synthase-like protein [Methylotenera sp.]MDP3777655.1 sll0787 family AIR synthase-like protein [Methylotenera sp.]